MRGMITRILKMTAPADTSSPAPAPADQRAVPSQEELDFIALQLQAGDYCLQSRNSRKLSIVVSGTDQDGYVLLPVNSQLTFHRKGKQYAAEVKAHIAELIPALGDTAINFSLILPQISVTLPNIGIEAGDIIYPYATDDIDRYQVKTIQFLQPNLVTLEAILCS